MNESVGELFKNRGITKRYQPKKRIYSEVFVSWKDEEAKNCLCNLIARMQLPYCIGIADIPQSYT